MKIKRILLTLLIITAGCSKKGENTDKTDPKPSIPVLTVPAQNEVCTSGTILSDTTSAITFKWGIVAHADSYELYIQNLLNNQYITRSLSATSLVVTLKRNTPYNWYVIAKGAAGDANSEGWKFYVAGLAVTTYAPFPAELISPYQGEVLLTSTPVMLSWKGSSVSNNIAGYDLYFGTTSTPPLFKADLLPIYGSRSVEVQRGNTYYWRVVTKDVNGNTSTSPLFQFNNR